MSFDPEHLIELEHQTWRALSTDGAALLTFLSDDCFMIFPGGMKVSKDTDPNFEEILRSKHFVPWIEYKMSDVDVTQAGPMTGIVSYKVKASREKDKKDEFRALMSTTWKYDATTGKWLMVFHQQSPF